MVTQRASKLPQGSSKLLDVCTLCAAGQSVKAAHEVTLCCRLSGLEVLDLANNLGICGAVATQGIAELRIPPYTHDFGPCSAQTPSAAPIPGPT